MGTWNEVRERAITRVLTGFGGGFIGNIYTKGFK